MWHDGLGVGKTQECCNPRALTIGEEKWLLSKVTVEALPYGSRYEAKFNKWVSRCMHAVNRARQRL